MESQNNNKNNSLDQIDSEESGEELDYEELTSHKIDKNVMSQKRKKRLIIILEHAYNFLNK